MIRIRYAGSVAHQANRPQRTPETGKSRAPHDVLPERQVGRVERVSPLRPGLSTLSIDLDPSTSPALH
jgi:hypothetical protein